MIRKGQRNPGRLVQGLVPIPRYFFKKCVWLSLMEYLFFSITFSNLLLLQGRKLLILYIDLFPSPLSLFSYSFINFSVGLFGFVLESNYIFHK